MAAFIEDLLAVGKPVASQNPSGTQAISVITQTRQRVLAHGEDAVVRDVLQQVQQLSPQACKALRALFLAIRAPTYNSSIAPSDAAACSKLLSSLFAQLTTWVQQIPSDEQQMASDLIAAFLPELEHLQATNIVQLLYSCLSALEENKLHCCVQLELVPQCLLAIAAAANTKVANSSAAADTPAAEQAAEESAQEKEEPLAEATFYRDTAVSRILHSKSWQPEQVGQILQVLKHIPMTKEQVEKAIKKTVNVCRSASLQQLPPVLYQLLLLSAAGGARSTALLGLSKLFEYLEGQPNNQTAAVGDLGPIASRTLLQVEATLLMHISTMLKYDAALGSEWLKWLKSNIAANQFLLQVSLTICRHHKLEQPVQQLLKKAVQQACEDESAEGSSSACRWLSSRRTAARGPLLQELERALLKAVRCSEYASELVCPGLLQLAASLLTTPCSCPMHIVMAARQGKHGSLPPQASAGARAVRLGLLLLQEVFQVHAEARGEVLKACQGQLSCSNLDGALPHVLLLSSICRDQPALLSSYIPQLKDCLGSFAGLSADAALVLLLALWPLCRVRSDLQDHVIMLLRKMMYRQDVGGRLVAIRGFLCLILQTLADAPGGALGGSDPSVAGCSQASLSQMSSLSGSGGINLLQELSVVLRRALGQQAPVREALYKGLLQVLAADPCSHELLCELLLPHMQSYMLEDDQQLPPLQLHRCAGTVQGEPVLLEPLPALLSCVHRLATEHAAATSGDWNTGTADNSSGALQTCFNTIRTQLGRCDLEHFELGGPADLNPLTPDGLLAQMHAANLLGVLEVVLEDVIMEARQLKEEQGDRLDAGQVTRLGEELSKLFDLHKHVYHLALEGSKSGGKKGKKKGPGAAAAGDEAAGQQATVGQKRGKPSSSFTPVQKLAPHMTASCLALLCNAVVDDGLLQLPDDADVTLVNHHVQLARDANFRSFVLRSCANLLEGALSAAASAALLALDPQGGAAAVPASAEVLQLGPVLFRVAKLIMQTATPGGRSAGTSRSGGGSSSGPAEAHSDSLEQLSANALLQLLKLADATQQLAALFKKLPVEKEGQEVNQQQQQEGEQGEGGAVAGDTAAAVAVAVTPRLPQIGQCIDKLMQNSCFKEAQTMTECLMLLGRQLGHEAPQDHNTASEAANPQQQQQKGVPASVELSRWAEGALQQDEPEVKSVGLAKALLEMYIRFAANDLAALKITVSEIQLLVGDTDEDSTQATQLHGSVLPLLTGTRTAQPCAAAPMNYIDESLGQIERLLAGSLKAGVVQDGDSSSIAAERALLAKEVCKRMQGLLECMAVLVNTIFAMPPIVDQQVRILNHVYKVLASIAKVHQLPKAAVAAGKTLSKEFEELVSMVHKELTHRVYHFLSDEQETQRNMKVNITRIKREAKMIPTLIFNMEDWEKQLVATGKAVSKNLLKDARRATCRDFKINNPELKAAAAAAAAGAARSGGSGGAAAAAGGSRSVGVSGGRSGGSRPGSRQHSEQGSDAADADGGEEVEGEADEEDMEDADAENQDPADEEMEDASAGVAAVKKQLFNSQASNAARRPPLHPSH